MSLPFDIQFGDKIDMSKLSPELLDMMIREQKYQVKAENKKCQKKINLGYMKVADGAWKDEPDKNGNTVCPNEIILRKTSIEIIYDYPMARPVKIKHTSDSLLGFTRKELSIQIMNNYKKIYDEENGGPIDNTKCIPQSMNRGESFGVYGIWGHHITDLFLGSLIISDNKYYISMNS